MTIWTRIAPRRASRPAITDCEVMTTTTSGARRIKVKLPAALVTSLAWERGTPIEVSFGQDGNATRLRLRYCTEGHGYRLQKEGQSSTHFLVFTPPAHPVMQKRAALTVRHVISEEGVILTVPAWVALGDPPAKEKAAA